MSPPANTDALKDFLLRSLHPRGLFTVLHPEAWLFFFKEEKTNFGVFAGIVLAWQLLITGPWVWGFVRAMLVFLAWRRFMAGGVCVSSVRLDGKTAIVTGANVGIGKETAKDLLARGARVILACRNLDKAEKTRKELVSIGSRVEVRELDLSSLASVRKFVKGFSGQDLHLLVNNAGVMACPYSETEDGFELQMATNHLGHFLLTNLLLPALRRHGKPARVVTVSSCAHFCGEMDFDNWMKKEVYDKDQAYKNSKLANILFTRELADKVKDSNVQVFSLHPGVVHSEIGRHVVPALIMKYICPLLLKSTAEGAQSSLHCALEASQDASCGHYFSDCAPGWPVPAAESDPVAKELWRRSEELVGLAK